VSCDHHFEEIDGAWGCTKCGSEMSQEDNAMKHTPGPWQIKSEYEPLSIIGNVDGPDDGQYHYTSICEVEPTLFPDENAANARLIAAAPELLAALVKIEGLADEHARAGDHHGTLLLIRTVARAALNPTR
jgi:hypothetical protein